MKKIDFFLLLPPVKGFERQEKNSVLSVISYFFGNIPFLELRALPLLRDQRFRRFSKLCFSSWNGRNRRPGDFASGCQFTPLDRSRSTACTVLFRAFAIVCTFRYPASCGGVSRSWQPYLSEYFSYFFRTALARMSKSWYLLSHYF